MAIDFVLPHELAGRCGTACCREGPRAGCRENVGLAMLLGPIPARSRTRPPPGYLREGGDDGPASRRPRSARSRGSRGGGARAGAPRRRRARRGRPTRLRLLARLWRGFDVRLDQARLLDPQPPLHRRAKALPSPGPRSRRRFAAGTPAAVGRRPSSTRWPGPTPSASSAERPRKPPLPVDDSPLRRGRASRPSRSRASSSSRDEPPHPDPPPTPLPAPPPRPRPPASTPPGGWGGRKGGEKGEIEHSPPSPPRGAEAPRHLRRRPRLGLRARRHRGPLRRGVPRVDPRRGASA